MKGVDSYHSEVTCFETQARQVTQVGPVDYRREGVPIRRSRPFLYTHQPNPLTESAHADRTSVPFSPRQSSPTFSLFTPRYTSKITPSSLFHSRLAPSSFRITTYPNGPNRLGTWTQMERDDDGMGQDEEKEKKNTHREEARGREGARGRERGRERERERERERDAR